MHPRLTRGRGAERKLPLLYVLDSAVKNVGLPYPTLVARNLPRHFDAAYAAARPGAERVALEKLARSWDTRLPRACVEACFITIKRLGSSWSAADRARAAAAAQGAPLKPVQVQAQGQQPQQPASRHAALLAQRRAQEQHERQAAELKAAQQALEEQQRALAARVLFVGKTRR